ncbi:hypothetical protein PG990_014877 [Apiospora arundinis]
MAGVTSPILIALRYTQNQTHFVQVTVLNWRMILVLTIVIFGSILLAAADDTNLLEARDDGVRYPVAPSQTPPDGTRDTDHTPLEDKDRRAERDNLKCGVASKKTARCDKSQCKADENCMWGKGGCQMRKDINGFKKPYACSLCRCIIL